MGTNWEAKRKIIPLRRNERVQQTYYVTDIASHVSQSVAFLNFLFCVRSCRLALIAVITISANANYKGRSIT